MAAGPELAVNCERGNWKERLAPACNTAVASGSSADGAADHHHQVQISLPALIAHELRGPLSALALSSEVLSQNFREMAPEQARGMLMTIHRRALWLQELVENLLRQEAILSGRLQIQPSIIDLVSLAQEVSSLVEPLANLQQQQIRVRPEGEVPMVFADRGGIGQVLMNLVLNATKFSSAGSVIDISLATGSDTLRVSVADRGPGVCEEHVQHVFEPYFRASVPGALTSSGLGLGLAIVKTTVEAHGGQVAVENRRGGGARFWFELPLVITRRSSNPANQGSERMNP